MLFRSAAAVRTGGRGQAAPGGVVVGEGEQEVVADRVGWPWSRRPPFFLAAGDEAAVGEEARGAGRRAAWGRRRESLAARCCRGSGGSRRIIKFIDYKED